MTDEKNVLISVVVPVYNVEAYLRECVDSILQQTYSALEVILVDDGSTDYSGEICQEYSKKDGRVFTYHKTNGGLSDARNYGIERANGDYLVLVDGDDTLEPTYVASLYQAITACQADVALCSFNLVDETYTKYAEVILPVPSGQADGHQLLGEVLTSYGYCFVVAWNKIYRREIFDKIRFEKGKLYEDEYMNYQLFWYFNKVAIVKEPLYNYVQRRGSIINSSMTMKKIEMKKEVQQRRMTFYQEHGELILYQKAAQLYCNWLINCQKDYPSLFSKVERQQAQEEFRKLVKHITVKQHYTIYLQNILGFIDLRLASLLKQIIKRTE